MSVISNIIIKLGAIICAITMLIFFYSCTKEYPINREQLPPKLVLNSIVKQGDKFVINVSRTVNINNKYNLDNLFIDDALVKLYEGDVYLETLNYDSLGYYSSQNLALKDKNYKITVEKDNFKTATAYYEFIPPSEISVTKMDTEIFDTIYQYQRPVDGEINLHRVKLYLTVRITDNPYKTDYYIIDVIGESQEIMIHNIINNDSLDSFVELGELLNGSLYPYLDYISENEIYRQSGFEMWKDIRGLIIPDYKFNGQTVEMQYVLQYLTPELKDIELVVHSIPESLVQYRRSVELYSNTFDNPYSEPVNVFSNIENGLGFSCGIARFQDSFYPN